MFFIQHIDSHGSFLPKWLNDCSSDQYKKKCQNVIMDFKKIFPVTLSTVFTEKRKQLIVCQSRVTGILSLQRHSVKSILVIVQNCVAFQSVKHTTAWSLKALNQIKPSLKNPLKTSNMEETNRHIFIFFLKKISSVNAVSGTNKMSFIHSNVAWKI